MIRLQQIKCPIPHDQNYLERKICRTLGISADKLIDWQIVRRSIDARKKPELFYIYTVDCTVSSEKKLKKKADGRTILLHEETCYRFPEEGGCPLSCHPVIAGSGPAGLFCAYMLASHGYQPLVLERGDEASRRKEKVDHFWNTGTLDIQSNVQFGEGGAGTFSDGKLNTSVKDPVGRNRLVLETFVRFGAPPSIIYDQKPHLGTDILIGIVQAMREETERLGGCFLFRHQLTGLDVQNGQLKGVLVNDTMGISTEVLVTAIGHSAR
ncbi:MAG TPA: FAD-dependent oxidoreductase, partial [Lachnospiraceae bacterium]|nr:FAD-dependent oxidoreductase [Lachnospiraceae bacterium]